MTAATRVPKKRDYGGGLAHPAPFSDKVLNAISLRLRPGWRVLDPFAGVGRIHELRSRVPNLITVGVEIEPEWAALHPDTKQGDAMRLRNRDATFDAIATSPTFGNRMADHHNASDPGERRSYTHDLGHPLDKRNTGGMQWGSAYRAMHVAALKEMHRVLKPGGPAIINIKDHIRDGSRMPVVAWWCNAAGRLGFILDTDQTVVMGGDSLHTGANGRIRVNEEYVLVLTKER